MGLVQCITISFFIQMDYLPGTRNNYTRSQSFLRPNIVIIIVDKPTVLNKRLWLVSVVQRKMRFIIGE